MFRRPVHLTRFIRVFYCPVVATILTLAFSSCAAPTTTLLKRNARFSYSPWSSGERHPTLEPRGDDHQGGSSSFVDQAFKIYARYITKIDDARCEHHPTCSRYTRDAIRKHGMIVGVFLAVDRLVRGSRSSALRELELYKIENGRPSFEDPIENNDFFF